MGNGRLLSEDQNSAKLGVIVGSKRKTQGLGSNKIDSCIRIEREMIGCTRNKGT